MREDETKCPKCGEEYSLVEEPQAAPAAPYQPAPVAVAPSATMPVVAPQSGVGRVPQPAKSIGGKRRGAAAQAPRKPGEPPF
jgi:hypothetical protein